LKSSELIETLKKTVVYSNVDYVIEYDEILKYCEKILNKKTFQQDTDLIIKYLEVNKKLITFEISNKKYVKFVTSMNQNVTPVSQLETSYIDLKQTESKLEKDSLKLENEITALNEQIKVYLKQNNKNLAMKCLKKRKILEKSLCTKDNNLSNVQAILMTIQQADTNQMTYDIYNKSSVALKEANKNVNIDKLDDTIQDLQDMIYTNNELEEVLSKSPLPSRMYNVDESELNLELSDLLANTNVYDKKTINLEKVDESFDLSGLLESLPEVPNDKLFKKISIKQ
jgi:hypothetical protein